MPQTTREIIARLAHAHLPWHFAVETSRRFNEGLSKYGVGNHLRPDCAETCHACGQRIVHHYPCSFCPYCGVDVRPYDAARECAEELLDAHNQCGIAQRRAAWPTWKVQSVAKLCGIGLALLDARDEADVREWVQMIAQVRSPSGLPGADAEEL